MSNPDYPWADAILALIVSDASTPSEMAREAGLNPNGEDLASIDLSGLDLRDHDFKGWNLASADFAGAMLSGADFRGAIVDPKRFVTSEDWRDAVLDASLRAAVEKEELLSRKLLDQELSVRTVKAFRSAGILTVGDVVQLTEAQALRLTNFGRKSLNETKEFLARMGLHLGMDIPS